MAKKKKIVEEPQSEEEEQFHVEVITKARVNDEGSWDYFVKWANYDSDYNTWEPEENVRGCERLLAGFWKDIGEDNDDYDTGYTVYATPTWVAKERSFFAKHFGSGDGKNKEQESSSEEVEEIVQISSKQDKKAQKASGSSKKREAKRLASETEFASPSMTGSRKKLKKPATLHKPDKDESEDSEDNVPLKPKKVVHVRKKRAARESNSPSDAESSDGKPLRKIKKVSLKVNAPRNENTPSAKGKAKAKTKVLPVSDSEEDRSDGMKSLFSEPSSPDVSLASQELPPDTPRPQPSMSRPPITKQSSSASNISTIKERRSTKGMPLETKSSGAVGGIPTKMRLAQSAQVLKPARPSASSSTQRNNLSKLSFKKITGPSSTTTTPVQESQPMPRTMASGSSMPRRTTESPLPTEIITDVPHFVQSPASNQDRLPSAEPFSANPEPTHQVEPEQRRPPMPLPRRSIAQLPRQSPVEPTAEVDRFLSTIMPAALAAPMDESAGENRTSQSTAAQPTAPSKPQGLGRFDPKKWKWTGELFIDMDSGRALRLCNITLHDATDPRPNGLRFSICLTSVDSIRVNKFHGVADLYMILRACSAVQQFAKLGPQVEEDADAVKTLAAYMRHKCAFTYARLSLDGIEVALMLIFPSSIAKLCEFLKVPANLKENNPVIAALIPWELTRSEYEDASWFKPRPTAFDGNSLDPALAEAMRRFSNVAEFQRALRVLKFPKSVLDFMSLPKQTYCVWYTPADVKFETISLRAILSICKATDVGHKTDVRAVFVHVGALATLYKLPALAERRWKRPDIRFYTFGTHESVAPDRWGTHEIFPLGGIVTFTPSAIIGNIPEAYALIRKLDEHPLWQCYILPSVVAMLAKLTCQGQNPLALYDKGEFLLDDLLTFIEEGKLPFFKWIGWQFRSLAMSPRDLLEDSIKVASEQYTNTRESDLPEAIQKEIARDLWAMQMQPAIMDEYRRLVVVKSKSDRYFNEDKEGIECVSLGQFDFKDDYFSQSA